MNFGPLTAKCLWHFIIIIIVIIIIIIVVVTVMWLSLV